MIATVGVYGAGKKIKFYPVGLWYAWNRETIDRGGAVRRQWRSFVSAWKANHIPEWAGDFLFLGGGACRSQSVPDEWSLVAAALAKSLLWQRFLTGRNFYHFNAKGRKGS